MVQRASRGDSEAFAELHGLFARRVFGLCRHLLGSKEAAEDATSEVFMRVHRVLRGDQSNYNPDLPFVPWLLSVASHYCVDQLRRRGIEARLFSSPSPEAFEDAAAEAQDSWTSPTPASPLQQLLAEENLKAVQEALARLPERYRVPLVLRYYSELSYDQIAQTLDLNRNHVATLIFRAKRELRLALAPPINAEAHKEPSSS